MPHLLANSLEVYWNKLMESEDLCNKLAAANVTRFVAGLFAKAGCCLKQTVLAHITQ